MTAEIERKPDTTIDGLSIPSSGSDEKRHFVFRCINVNTVNIISRLLAECIGTAILMLFGCASGLGWKTQPADFVGALGFGLVVMIIVQTFGEISGAHVNPVVSLCALLHKTLSIWMFIAYLIAQVLGAFVGFGLLVLLTPTHIFRPDPEAIVGHCSTVPVDGMSIAQTFTIEFLATMVLIALCCASWDPRNASKVDSVALKFGFAVAGLSLAFGSATGCSMNPARTLAPAIWNNDWTMHWLYWVAPLSSSLVTTLIYKAVFAVYPSPTAKRLTDASPST